VCGAVAIGLSVFTPAFWWQLKRPAKEPLPLLFIFHLSSLCLYCGEYLLLTTSTPRQVVIFSCLHTTTTTYSNNDSISGKMPPPQSNGRVNGNGSDAHSEDSASEVGVAFTTSGPVGTSAASFNQQYLEQQQAYQRAMQEHHQERKYSRHEDHRNAPGGSQSSSLPSSLSGDDHSPLAAAPLSHIPAQNRVFGLTKDLNGPSVETAHLEESQRLRNRGSQESLSSLADVTSPQRLTKTPSGASASNSPAGTSNKDQSGEGPQFSVEVVAPAFDQRGYPVFSGRGARIRGYLRTRAIQGGEVLITVSRLGSQEMKEAAC
jgi:hypothetical protein